MAQMIIVTRKRGLLTTVGTKELRTSADFELAAVVTSGAGGAGGVTWATLGALVTNSVTPGSSGALGASVAGAGAEAAASSAGAGAASSAGAQLTVTRRQSARKAKQRRRLVWEAILSIKE